MAASLIMGAGIFVSTEAMSRMRLLRPEAAVVIWSSGVLAAIIASRKPKRSLSLLPARIDLIDAPLSILIALVAVTLIALGILAFTIPPNANDGLIYHLPRVLHWRQNGSVELYPTNILRQIEMPPFAEYVLLHLHLLTGTMAFANLVQWSCLLESAVGVTVIAKQLELSPRLQALSALLCVTIPIAVVIATGPKNDLVATYWFVCLMWLLIRFSACPTRLVGLGAGTALGLALATKGSAAVMAVGPLAVFGLLGMSRNWRLRALAKLVPAGVLLISVAILIASPQGLRNYALFGSPLGPDRDGPSADYAYRNRTFTPAHAVSNVIRPIAFQLGTPWTEVTSKTDALVYALHDWLNVGIDDAKTTFSGRDYFKVRASPNDDNAPNPVHTLLICWAGIAVFLSARQKSWFVRPYAASLILSFFAACLIMTYLPAVVRYQLPLMVLWCPIIALIVGSWKRTSLLALVSLLLAGALHATLVNRARPLIGPESVLAQDRLLTEFGDRTRYRDVYLEAAEFLNQFQCQSVGLAFGWDDPEYVWWRILAGASTGFTRLHHVVNNNVSASLKDPTDVTASTCAIIDTDDAPPDDMDVQGTHFLPAWQKRSTTLYLPEGTAPRQVLQYSAAYDSNPPLRWQSQERRVYGVSVLNQGAATWPAQRTLLSVQFGPSSDQPQGSWEIEQRFPLTADVPPGHSIRMDLDVRAPRQTGRFTLRHRLMSSGTSFPQVQDWQVVVVR
ncbi:MAG TPA: hypothetical protein VHX16_13855 [Chloroflexota bacterium]|nr:hypothetical protein [Chloroflexota bacterium]